MSKELSEDCFGAVGQGFEGKRHETSQVASNDYKVVFTVQLRLLSSACYGSVGQSGVLVLHSDCTLCDYTQYVKTQSGFSVGVDKQSQAEAKLITITDYQKHVCLIFDEVKIKEDLMYNKHTGEFMGLSVLSDLNECLLKF